MKQKDNPYRNGKRELWKDIADGVLRCHELGYVDDDGNVYDVFGYFLFNEYEAKQ